MTALAGTQPWPLRTPQRCGVPHRRLGPLPRPAASTAEAFTLPSGLTFRHFTKEELVFLYNEVLVERVYSRHVVLRPGDTVVDVGANTGLFSILAAQEVKSTGTVVALEPLPSTFELLQANVAAHKEWCAARGMEAAAPILLNCGAGAEGQDAAVFTSYGPRASGWSSMYPDDAEIASNMRNYMSNLLAGSDAPAGEAAMPEPPLARLARALYTRAPPLQPLLNSAASMYVKLMLSEQKQWSCRLVPLRSVIADCGLTRIDLLKVDVERAELDVLSGLSPADWPLVQQAVLEVHDIDGRLAVVEAQLRSKGFARVIAEQEASLKGSGIYNVYALR